MKPAAVRTARTPGTSVNGETGVHSPSTYAAASKRKFFGLPIWKGLGCVLLPEEPDEPPPLVELKIF